MASRYSRDFIVLPGEGREEELSPAPSPGEWRQVIETDDGGHLAEIIVVQIKAPSHIA